MHVIMGCQVCYLWVGPSEGGLETSGSNPEPLGWESKTLTSILLLVPVCPPHGRRRIFPKAVVMLPASQLTSHRGHLYSVMPLIFL